jgi:hypothetical protein
VALLVFYEMSECTGSLCYTFLERFTDEPSRLLFTPVFR